MTTRFWTIPNAISVARMAMIPFIVQAVLQGAWMTAFVLFAIAGISDGVDGLIAVTHGAGGHAGALNPFAAMHEIRKVFDGTLLLGGVVSTGAQVAAARLMGADMVYMGTRFLSTTESHAVARQREMILAGTAEDIVYTPKVSGIPGNFLRESLRAAGLDPDDLSPPDKLNFGTGEDIKAWRDLWAAGQGIGAIEDMPRTAELCDRIGAEYEATASDAATLLARDLRRG